MFAEYACCHSQAKRFILDAVIAYIPMLYNGLLGLGVQAAQSDLAAFYKMECVRWVYVS